MNDAGWVRRNVVGADIGGANLKYCSHTEQSRSRSFPMWKHSQSLAQALVADLARFDSIGALAVTMTGELADCFADRSEGVSTIVDQVMTAASAVGVDVVRFYGVDGKFHSASQAKSQFDLVAAANWHALASFTAGRFPTATSLVDIGSTTTDLIPLSAGRVVTTAQSDFDRLAEGSLVYVGCRRTPVCALVDELRFAGIKCQVMNEVFATIDDAMLLVGGCGEDDQDCDTPDHRPRTRPFAANRLARMIGLDQRTVTIDNAIGLANQVMDAARQRIGQAWRKIQGDGLVVIAGHGAGLLPIDDEWPILSLADQLGAEVSRCAPAFAVAKLFAATHAVNQIPCDAS